MKGEEPPGYHNNNNKSMMSPVMTCGVLYITNYNYNRCESSDLSIQTKSDLKCVWLETNNELMAHDNLDRYSFHSDFSIRSQAENMASTNTHYRHKSQKPEHSIKENCSVVSSRNFI